MKGKKGARATIGKKRVDGESVHTSASFWAWPFKQQTKRLQRLDMQAWCCKVGWRKKTATAMWQVKSKRIQEYEQNKEKWF